MQDKKQRLQLLEDIEEINRIAGLGALIFQQMEGKCTKYRCEPACELFPEPVTMQKAKTLADYYGLSATFFTDRGPNPEPVPSGVYQVHFHD